ncbi:MAG: discoidin domain-containing protein, partial [Kordiimonas sp.]
GIEAGQYRKLHPPKAFEVLVSNDNATWISVGKLDEAAIMLAGNTLTVSFDPVSARYLKVVATNGGTYFSAQFQEDKAKNIHMDEIAVH